MLLSLRDVMARPADAEAMELLKDEYKKWCVGRLDDDGEESGDEEDRNNNDDEVNPQHGLPNVSGAFNVRALARVEFPRTWVVPLGTIPAACYTNAAVNGGTDMSLLVDYSRTRGVVRVRSELLKPTGDGGLPQKVLAVWPKRRPRSTQQEGQQQEEEEEEQAVLYWPAFVTRVVGVFADPSLDGSPASHAWLQAHERFDDILAAALRSPMRVCVDVAFCIDEVSAARRLTIAPAVRYPVGAATTPDPEIARVSQRAASEADCPLLVPAAVPEVVSIRNYSYTAVAGKGRRPRSPSYTSAAATPSAGATPAGDAASRRGSGGAGVAAAAVGLATKAKLNRNTLSHSPIALLDMLAGPVCQTQQFVFLRPTAQLAVAVQRAAVEELCALWHRLRCALFEPLCAEESLLPSLRAAEIGLPSLRAESVREAAEPPLQLPDPDTYVSPYVQADRTKTEEEVRPPPSANPPHALTFAELQCCLPTLQGRSGGVTREAAVQRRRRQQQRAHAPTAFEAAGGAARSQMFAGARSPSQGELPSEDGTDAGAVGGTAGMPKSVRRANASGLAVAPGDSSLRRCNSLSPPSGVGALVMSPSPDARRGRQASVQATPERRETAAACPVRWAVGTKSEGSDGNAATVNENDAGVGAAVDSRRRTAQVAGEVSAPSWRSPTCDVNSEESSPQSPLRWHASRQGGVSNRAKQAGALRAPSPHAGEASPLRDLEVNAGALAVCAPASPPDAADSAQPDNGAAAGAANHEEPIGRHAQKEAENARRQPSPAPHLRHLIEPACDDAASIAVPQASLLSRAARLPRGGTGHVANGSRGHSAPLPRSCAPRRSRFSTAGTAGSCRYAMTAWRDPSGVEIDVDDARLLPPAVARAARANLGPRPRPKLRFTWSCPMCGEQGTRMPEDPR
ncbi:uncharacterized protein Tco025E_01763 [Trypanosoma conorhini]|uniref:Uncharacterized protein n=1 Tax=Trypanosoma conorhini TaxID=83891 RepID=A0A3R7LF42_9TRYP|nr:uncharacterized protein Tco025E_01763 [Trypanosoma conorhini]RNF26014.1 hypothetical protein Tco025E_01763 [Trypanosoma conorhini]